MKLLLVLAACVLTVNSNEYDQTSPFMRSRRKHSSSFFDDLEDDWPSIRYEDDWQSRRNRYQDEWPSKRYQDDWESRRDQYQDDWSSKRHRFHDDWSSTRDQNDWPPRRFQNDWESRRDRYQEDSLFEHTQDEWSSRNDRYRDGWSSRRSHSCSNNKLRALVSEMVSVRDAFLIKSTWEIVKENSAFIPKVYLRYFKASPENKLMFPKFAHVPLLDLPTNNDFLLQAYTSVSTINSIINYYDPTTGYTEGCPDFSGMRRKLKSVDLKKLRKIWMNTLQEELGYLFTPEVRTAWDNVFKVARIYSNGSK